MTDRDELADIAAHHITVAGLMPERIDSAVGFMVALYIADAILARWRLVPVENEREDLTDRELEMMKWGRDQGYGQALDAAASLAHVGGVAAIRELIKRRTHDAQRRAAGELTRHDQAAGIYDDDDITIRDKAAWYGKRHED